MGVQRSQVVLAQAELKVVRKALASKPPNYDLCLSSATTALTLSPNSEELRLLRAECYLQTQDWDSTVGDLSRAAALSPSLPPHLLLRVALVSALLLDNGLSISPDALLPLKRCLSADPDSKACRGAFKALKKIEKDLSKLRNWVDGGRWGEAALTIAGSSTSSGVLSTLRALLESYQSPLPSSPSFPAPLPTSPTLERASPLITHLLSTLCKAYVTLGQTRKAGPACEDILERSPEDVWGLVGRGDKLMTEENWEEAVQALSAAFEATGRSDREVSMRGLGSEDGS